MTPQQIDGMAKCSCGSDVDAAIAERLASSLHLAGDASDVVMSHFRQRRGDADEKPDGSPVTIADLEAETCIRSGILATFPDDAIIGEEHGRENGTSGFTWVIDPIDGTVSFMHGVPLFGTLIGIEHDGLPVAGCMHFPALDETAWAAKGGGAWHQIGASEPCRVHVSTTVRLAEAMVCTTSFDYFRNERWEDAHERLAHASGRTRGWSDCYGELLLVTGRIDAVVEPVLNPWDISAIIAVLQEAGGRFTDWQGKQENRSCVSPGLASNGRIHDELLRVLAGR
ncbi:MAG: inositol monophosphatase family protein [Phycisphaerales bacterium]|nr:inositol monophosphatase family protein [Phycisphaerales bacterium]